MDRGFKLLHDALVSDLLERIKSDQPEPKQVGPDAFEQLVVDLLKAMYGGSGIRVGKAGDEGIDGIIRRDKLGLDLIYVQAKKWKDTSVGSPEIMKFSGALAGKGALYGVFITASEFTPDARRFVEGLQQKIALIGGKQLAELMIEYNVGVTDVSPPKTYQLKQLDETYFENL
jgi:restriction system protein